MKAIDEESEIYDMNILKRILLKQIKLNKKTIILNLIKSFECKFITL